MLEVLSPKAILHLGRIFEEKIWYQYFRTGLPGGGGGVGGTYDAGGNFPGCWHGTERISSLSGPLKPS